MATDTAIVMDITTDITMDIVPVMPEGAMIQGMLIEIQERDVPGQG